MVQVFDRYGKEQDWAWLEANYGPVVIHPADEGAGWRVAEIHENGDPVQGVQARQSHVEAVFGIQAAAIILVQAQHADGQPAEGVQVAWYWPDAPVDPQAGPANGLPEGMVPDRCDGPGRTDGNGNTGFAMGGGAYYFPPNRGPHAVWIYGKQTNCDVVWGLGMLGGTNHDSLWPVFRWSEGEEPPPPPPDECPVEEILRRVKVVERQCKKIRGLLSDQ